MSDVNANIGVHIDTSAALTELKALQRQLAQFHSQVSKSSAAAAAAQKNLQTNLLNSINATGKFRAQMGIIRTSTESFTNSLEKNKFSMREYFRYGMGATKTFGRAFKSEFDTIGKVAEERVKRMQTQYIKMGRDASGAMKAIAITPTTLNMKDYATQTAVAAQKQALLNQLLKQGSTNLLNFGKNTQWAGRQLMVGFTIPLAYFGTAAAKTFMDLEAQALKFRRVYGDMFTTTGETEKALGEIRDLANEFTKYGVAVTKTMEMAASAAAMGKTGAELTAQVANATRLAVLGNVEQEQALDTTISLTNAFGIAAEELTSKINFLNAVENQTVTSIEDLTIAIPKAGPVVKQLGGDVEDLAFFLTAMREGGINASESANALKSGLASLINPTKKASQMFADMGINIKDIVERNKGDLKRTVVEFAQALDTLDPLNRARGIEQLFGKFQFARLSTLFQNVTKDGTQAAKVLQMAGASVEELAILSERELKAVEDSIGTNFKEAVEQLKVSIAPIGKEFLKAITPVVRFLGDLFEKFNNLSDGSKKFIVILTTLVGLVGPTLLMTFGLVANGAANIIKLFILMRQGFLKLSGNTTNLAQQTQYMTNEQMEAATVAASLNQAHSRLTQQFTVEASAVLALRNAYIEATAAASRFAAANPGMMVPGAGRVPKAKFAGGTTEVVGGQPGKDSVPSLLMPGEAVVPTKIAQDDRFKPLIAALVTGEIAKYGEGSTEVSLGDRIYNAKSAKGAKGVRDFMDSLIKNPDGTFTYIDPKTREATTFTQDRLRKVFDYRSQPGKEFTASEIKRSLDIGSGARGSSRGTSRPPWISELVKQAKGSPTALAEEQAVRSALAQKGITGLSQDQQRNLFGLQASHIVEERDANGKKVWRAANLSPEPGYINNYLNTVKGNLGKELLALTDDQLKSLNIDKNELRKLVGGNHPTNANAANTLRSVAQYQIAKYPNLGNIYQAEAVVAGLGYRLKNNVYKGGLKTLAQMFPTNKKVMAEIAAAKGEVVQTKDGKRGVVTGQTGRAKPSGKNVTASPRDTRILTTKNLAKIFPYGVKGPRYAGAIDGFEDESNKAVGPRGLIERRQSQAEELKKSIDKNTASQDDGTKTQEKTAKELKQEQRFNKTQRMNAYAGPVAMAAGTGAMVAAMAGAPQTMTNFLFGLSAISGLLPLLANPLGMAVAGIAALGIAVYKFNSDIKKAREEGAALAKSMTMTNSKLIELSKITGTVSATEEAKRKRETVLTGASGVQRKTGQTILESEVGKGILGDIEAQKKTGASNTEIAKSVGVGLSTAIMQGVLTTEQAKSLAAALGEKLGNYDIPAQISGTIVRLVGPNGEKLESEPLQVALAIKKESMQQQAQQFQNAMSARKPLVTPGGTAQVLGGASLMAAGGAIAATGVGAPVGGAIAAIGAVVTLAELKEQNDKKAQNLKLDTAAIQLGLEAVAQGQGLVDSLNKQYDNKIKQAKTTAEIAELEKQRKSAIDAVNAENAKTLDILLEQKDQFSPGAFDAAIKAAADVMYKEGPMAVFKDETIKALNGLENSDFKTTLQLGFASGEMDPNQIIALIEMASNNEDIKKNIELIVSQSGMAEANVLIGLLEKAGANEATYKIITSIADDNPESTKRVQDALSVISNILPEYGVNVDINTNGEQKLKEVMKYQQMLAGMPNPLTKDAIIKLSEQNPDDQKLKDILANWNELTGGATTIDKTVVTRFAAVYDDQNVKNFYSTSTAGTTPRTVRGQPVPVDAGKAATYLLGTKGKATFGGGAGGGGGGAGGAGSRDTTLDELLKRLKFIRKASIDAEKGVGELMRITKGKGLTKFGGVMQQLMAGPKGGFNREFIGFLEQMDNKTRKTYMSVKNGEVVLTKQGKALKEAFNEKAIGEFQVAQVQTIQDTLAQRAALLKLKSAGVDNATALEMVADASLAVAINSKNIDSTELQNMARNAKKAKDEVADLNLEVQNLGVSIGDRIKNLNTTIAALQAARAAGLTSADLLQYISSNQALADQIAKKGINDPVVQDILKNQPKISDLEGAIDGLVDPLKKVQEDFDKARAKADAFYSYLENQANASYKKWLQDTKTTFEGVEYSISDAIDKIREKLDEYQEELGDKQRQVELNFDRPMDALREEIDDIQRQIELQFDRPIEGLQNEIEGLQRQIELQFDRPIQALQDESGRLSNDLTLMDRAADAINKKYDAQEEALNKISELNQDIIAQEKQRISLADAITQGDISAAAQAAQDMRAASAASAAQRAGGVLGQARETEIAGLRSAGGMTRAQIEERQFQIGQQVYQLEQGRAAIQAQILIKQDAIYKLEQGKLPLLAQIRDKEDQIYALQELKEAELLKIRDLEDKIYNLTENTLEPLEKQVAAREKQLKAELDAIQAQKDKWDATQLAIDAAKLKADGFDTTMKGIEDKTANMLKNWNNIQSKVVTLTINEVRKVTVIEEKVTVPPKGALSENKLMYGGKVKPMAYGGRVGSDYVPAMLTPGEFVVNRFATKQFGPLLEAMNNSKYPSLMGGGILAQPSYDISSPTNISMPFNNNMSSVSNNSTAVYNYNVGINVSGTNMTPGSIARTVMDEIKYIDSQRIVGQRA